MIACLKRESLKQSLEVQKDLELDKLVDSLEYFESRDKAYEQGYVPVCFITALRTVYSNLVVEHTTSTGCKNYVSLNISQKLPHKGYDLITYMASIAVAKLIDCTKQESQKIMFNSKFSPIGFYNPDDGVCDPVIYSHIIVNDDKADDLKSLLFEGNKLVPISNMNTKGNLQALLNELVIVKEEN